MLDLIIIGASAAGLSASVYAARRNLNFVVVAKDVGGEVALSGEIENWPSVIHTDGIALARAFHEQAKSYGVRIEEGVEVIAIKPKKKYQIVMAKDSTGKEILYEAKAILIASGIHPRELDIPGEKKLKGRGVTSCTVCDGPLFKGKVTATIGAGNSALESALMMGSIAQKVYLITKYPNSAETNGGFPKGEHILIEKVKSLTNVEIVHNANTIRINGEKKVTGLTYTDNTTLAEKEIVIDAAMIHVGMIPNSSFIEKIDKTPSKEIIIDLLGRTNLTGIFAAGDVTNIPFKQIAIASGQGVTAVLSAIDYINRWKE